MSGSMWGIGWVLVNMRVRKLLKRLLAAPMRRRHLFYAQALSRLVMIPIELVVILVFARLAFDVRMTGSWLALALVSVTGSASFAGIAILVASRAQNSETVSGLMNLVMLPMFVLSGVFFSSAHFPGVHAAGDQRAAADGAVQRLARRDRRRRRHRGHRGGAGRDGRLGRDQLRDRPARLPLGLTAIWRSPSARARSPTT